MTTTHELARDLQKLAEHLLTQPDTTTPGASVNIWADEKETFAAIARVFPRPMAKEIGNGPAATVDLKADVGKALRVRLTIWRDRVCRIVVPAKPAVYDCEPLLSDDELREVGQ